MGGSRQRTRVWRVGFWSLAVVVTVLSLTPPTHLPPQMFDLWDKAQHALAFAALASLGRLAYPRLGWSVVAAALLLHGAAIEAAQAATGWRHAEVADWLADAVGVGLVWSVAA
ncbi:VanZ family protein, partial [Tepidimonas sp.]|uniref:VanZ family protein n=1 Tax=Tepidimonas sp. TaxID=2002775 RepID=UPI002FE323EB